MIVSPFKPRPFTAKTSVEAGFFSGRNYFLNSVTDDYTLSVNFGQADIVRKGSLRNAGICRDVHMCRNYVCRIIEPG